MYNTLLEARELAGIKTPSFYDYIKGKELNILEAKEISDDVWDKIPEKFKGNYNGAKHYMTLENKCLGIVPVKGHVIVKDVMSTEKVNTDQETVEDGKEKDAHGEENPVKKAEEVVKSVETGNRKTTTESAQEIAAAIIKAVNAGNPPKEVKNDGEAASSKGSGFTDYLKLVNNPDAHAELNNDTAEAVAKNDETGKESRKKEKVEVPKKVMEQIDKRIAELKEAQKLEDNKGYDDHSLKVNAIEFLEKVKEHLSEQSQDGLIKAQVLFQTLSNNLSALLPAFLPVFLATAKNEKPGF